MSANPDTQRDIERIDKAYEQLVAKISAIAEIAKEALKANDQQNFINYANSLRQKVLMHPAYSEEFFSTIVAAFEKHGLKIDP